MDTQDVVQVPFAVGVAAVELRETGARLVARDVWYVGHVRFAARWELAGASAQARGRGQAAGGNGLPEGEAIDSFITDPTIHKGET